MLLLLFSLVKTTLLGIGLVVRLGGSETDSAKIVRVGMTFEELRTVLDVVFELQALLLSIFELLLTLVVLLKTVGIGLLFNAVVLLFTLGVVALRAVGLFVTEVFELSVELALL